MKKKKKKYNIRYCLLAVLLLGSFPFFISCELSTDKKTTDTLIGDIKIPNKKNKPFSKDSISSEPFRGSYNIVFNDMHELHMQEVAKHGFAPMATRRDTSQMKGKVVYLKPGVYQNFVVDSLPHSMPVMIPVVAKLIEEIGANFRDSLKAINYPDCRIVITSITRTEEDIKQLRRQNRNAISESAHRFGTTFDISWIRFDQVDTLHTRVAYESVLKKTLAKVLYHMQQTKRCYIKHEDHQKCFHITVRRND